MKHFEASGLWYPSDDPDNAVGGTLKFDDDGLYLVLLGSFRPGWSPEAERYPLVHGVVGDCPYGSFVTLIDSFRTTQKFNMVGATSEKLYCHQAAIGNFHLSDNPITMESLELDFSYLTDWAGRSGIKVDRRLNETVTYIATYQKPENVTFKFADKTLTLGYHFNASQSLHQVTFSEAARLMIEPVDDISPKTVGRDHVRRLQDLLSFATDTPNEIEEIRYENAVDVHGEKSEFHLIFKPTFRLKTKKDSRHWMDMLFTLPECQSSGIDIFQRWLDFSDKRKDFCEVYFGHTYSIPSFLDDQFKKMVLALTLLCSTRQEMTEKTRRFLKTVEAAMKTQFDEDERAFLGHLIPIWGEVEMPIHLHQLLRENLDVTGRVIDDLPAFIRAISDTLNFVDRRERGDRPPLQGRDLHHAVEKIKLLIKIVVLKELGFGEDKVKTLIDKYLRLVAFRTM